MSKPIVANTDDFNAVVTESKGLTLVDFWAPWCGPCRLLAPTLEQVANEMDGKVQIVKVDIDQNPEISAQYRVMNIPFMVLFKDGNRVDQLLGNHPKEKITAMIQNHL